MRLHTGFAPSILEERVLTGPKKLLNGDVPCLMIVESTLNDLEEQ